MNRQQAGRHGQTTGQADRQILIIATPTKASSSADNVFTSQTEF